MFCRSIRTPAVIAGSFVAAMIAATPALGFGGTSGYACNSPGGPDVIVGDITGPTNYNAQSISGVMYDAFSIGTVSCNVGNVNALWQSFSNNSNRHPAISQNLFKYKTVNGAGRFEHIGQSWLKHGFFAFAQNLCCACNGQGNQVLGVGCSDPYTSARNGSQSGLGPKWQVHAASGWFPTPANPAFSGSVARRLRVRSSDLEPSGGGALYFVEGQYNTQDDAAAGNKNNNASYRQASISGGPSEFNMTLLSATVRAEPGIKAWQQIDPAVTLTNIETPETPIGVQNPFPAYDPNCCTTGLVIVGARATSLGGGIWHYEYAVQNQNSDRSIASFSIPLSGPVNITNIGFHDVDYHSNDGEGSVTRDGTDWVGTVVNGLGFTEIRWETTPYANNPNANALRWGTLYNFRFDADSPPTTGTVTLGMWKIPGTVTGDTVIPTPVDPPPACLADLSGDDNVGVPDLLMVINAWGPCPGCPEDLDGSGGVGVPDLLMVINAWGPCQAK